MRDGVQWLPLLIFVLILISFARRILKAQKARGGIVPPRTTRPSRGRKNDFRDIPPPPENPELG
jgi:hypothetical protein